jgi:hypothetical protein
MAPKHAAGDKTPNVALRVVDDKDRLGLAYWQDTLQWKRVTRLTPGLAELDQAPR